MRVSVHGEVRQAGGVLRAACRMHYCTYFARMVALSASSCASRSATRRASPASAIECGFADSSTLTACPCTVSCEVFDVAVDMRKNSATFGQWVGVMLSAENSRQLWVPAGFAHGFYVISESAEFVYKCTDYYHPESEVSVKYDDTDIGIHWPLVDGKKPSLSAKDEDGLDFSDAPTF